MIMEASQLNKLLEVNPKLAIKLILSEYSNYKEMINGIDWINIDCVDLKVNDSTNIQEIVFVCIVSKSIEYFKELYHLIHENDLIIISMILLAINDHVGQLANHFCVNTIQGHSHYYFCDDTLIKIDQVADAVRHNKSIFI